MPGPMLLIEFVPGSRIEREQEHTPGLPIVGNGPPGTFVHFASGRRVPLPTDQIVLVEGVCVSFGGMSFFGLERDQLVFHRVRDLVPANQLSPERRSRMTLEPEMVAAIFVDGKLVWPALQ
jgi:hypothetical protein